MKTGPDCPNDLVCHDQGECLRPTPETDAAETQYGDGNAMHAHCQDESHLSGDFADFARRLERERNEAREENARLREAIKRLAELDFGSQGWDEQCNRAAAVLRNLVK